MAIARPYLVCLFSLLISVLVPLTHAAELPVEPIPSFYQEPGLPSTRQTVNLHPAEHIDPFTGKLQYHHIDLHLPGNGGLDIDIQRSYSSLNEFLSEPSVLGVGWTMHYGRVLRTASLGLCVTTNISADKAPVLELPDGSRHILYLSIDETYWITTDWWRAKCGTDGRMTVSAPDGTRYEMNAQGPIVGSPGAQQNSWNTSRIIDRNGNTLDFTYQLTAGANAVTTITASDGRVVTLTYTDGLLSTVTDGTRIWTYTVETGSQPGYPFLSTVTRPDGTSWRYEYNGTTGTNAGAYSLNKVTNPNGGAFTYGYGFATFNINLPQTTVVISKTGDGASWQYSYVPATKLCTFHPESSECSYEDDAMLDRTTVHGPEGDRVYRHVGANSVGSGFVAAIGLPLQVDFGAYQTEAPGWSFKAISNMTNKRPGTSWITDGRIAAPMSAGRTISRYGQIYDTTLSDFDDFGNPQSIRETGPDGKGGTQTRTTIKQYSVDKDKWMLRLTSKEVIDNAGTISRGFDPNGNMLLETRFGVSTNFTYTPAGDIESKTDANSHTSTFSDYRRGVAQSESHPENVNLSRVVDDSGNITSVTDGELATTTYDYDGLNRIKSITHPLGNAVRVERPFNTRIVTRGDYIETTSYDGFGRDIKTVHQDLKTGEQISQSSQYDSLGNRLFTSYPNNEALGTGYFYDILGTIWQTAYAVNSARTTASGGVKTIGMQGNKVVITDENGFVRQEIYSAYGYPQQSQLVKTVEAEPATNLDITRNGIGQVLTVTQGGKTRSFQYDSHYFLTDAIHPETGTTHFGRDLVGNMTSKKTGSAGTTLYGYDDLDRLKLVTYEDGTPAVTRTYFKDSKLQTVDNTDAVVVYGYDQNKNLIQKTLSVDGKDFPLQYGYDANDAKATQTFSSGAVIDYAPDAFGRARTAGTVAPSLTYYPGGQLHTLTYGNGMVSNYALNPRLRPNTIQTGIPGAPLIIDVQYTYDFVGNVTAIRDAADAAYNKNLRFDKVHRLTGIDWAWGLNGLISYDGRGNLLRQSIGYETIDYGYGTNDLLQTVTGSQTLTYAYDTHGNVTNNARHTFQYSEADTMRCADCDTAAATAYVYDGEGMRVKAKTGDVTTYYEYGADGVLVTESKSDATSKQYIHVAGKQIAVRDIATVPAATETLTYFHPDLSGNVIAATSPGGQVLWKERASPYGERTGTLVADGNERQWFHGKPQDSESGLNYFGARYYDSAVGRFMGVDPKGFDEANVHSFNRYNYANNNPFRYVDPDGREPRPAVPRTEVYVFTKGKGFDFVAINGADRTIVTGEFNMTTDNFNQLRPGNYTIEPRPHVEEKTGVAGVVQKIGSMASGNRDGNVNKHEGQPLISNTGERGVVQYPNEKPSRGVTIHPGRDANGEGGNSLGCMVCNTSTFNRLNRELGENYNKGGAGMHIYAQ